MQSYRPQLDSLRAIAVTAVLFAHFWMPQTNLSVLGVRLFFVLSGFLLTAILLREREQGRVPTISRRRILTDFYARRVLRIWPAYYFALAAAVLFGAHALKETLAWHALFASNILFFLEQRWYPQVAAHLWTLSVEEQFYLVLPFAVLFLKPTSLRNVLIGSIVASVAYRVIVAVEVRPPLDFYVVLPIAQLDALAGGALLAFFQHQQRTLDWRRLIAWSLPVVLFLELLRLPEGLDFAAVSPLWLLPMIGLIAGAEKGIRGAAGAMLGSRPLVALGRISYGIYVYHLFVAAAFNKLAMLLGFAEIPNGPIAFLLFFSLTTGVAAASWFLLERPALSLRRYFGRGPHSGALIPAAPMPN